MARSRWLFILILATLLPRPVGAAPLCGTAPEMLLLVDRSGSMTGTVASKSKWSHATTAVKNLASKYTSQIRFALMIFPGVSGGECGAGLVNVPLALKNHVAISNYLASVYPTGKTPLGASLANAHAFFATLPAAKSQRSVLLITDGSETCGGKALNAVKALATAGIKTYVIGFGSGVNASELNNLALQGGTALPGAAKYYKADSSSQLNSALQSIASLVSCCGNGTVDAGETCDKAIPPGLKGACPKSAKACDDAKACTTDLPTGTECDVTCLHTPVTQPKSGDGCCPPGAHANNDTDCPASCGNGVLEKGEDCDPAISSGAGKCKTAADCADSDTCTADGIAGTACNPKCYNTPMKPDPSQKDGCCPKGNTLVQDADCPPRCGPDKKENCVDLCKGVDCPDGHYCNSGKCLPWPKGRGPEAGVGDGSTGWIPEADGCACRVASPEGPPAALGLLLLLLAAGRFRFR